MTLETHLTAHMIGVSACGEMITVTDCLRAREEVLEFALKQQGIQISSVYATIENVPDNAIGVVIAATSVVVNNIGQEIARSKPTLVQCRWFGTDGYELSNRIVKTALGNIRQIEEIDICIPLSF